MTASRHQLTPVSVPAPWRSALARRSPAVGRRRGPVHRDVAVEQRAVLDRQASHPDAARHRALALELEVTRHAGLALERALHAKVALEDEASDEHVARPERDRRAAGLAALSEAPWLRCSLIRVTNRFHRRCPSLLPFRST